MRLVSAAPQQQQTDPEPDAPGVLFAPDSFGGWRSSVEIARLVRTHLATHGLAVAVHPMSDGGEGLLDALLAHRPGVVERVPVRGPLRRGAVGATARTGGLTVVESASAIGLAGWGQGDPLQATSFSLGVLLCAAARKRRGSLVVGLGGTATLDAGLGVLQALGVRAVHAQGRPLEPGAGARQLFAIDRLEGDPTELGMLEVWCDVATPLARAPARFGPQKGLSPDDAPRLTAAFARFADLLNAWRRRRGLRALDPELPGGGAAGGVGFALAALDATLKPGAAAFADHTGLDAALRRAHTVILGEGRLDPSSFDGKVAQLVTRRARARGLRVAALVGQSVSPPDPPWGPDLIVEAGEVPDRESALARACSTLVQALR